MNQTIETEIHDGIHEPDSSALILAPKQYMQPVGTIEQMINKKAYFARIVGEVLKPAKDTKGHDFAGADYGILPGTKTKTLFKQGAENLCEIFGLFIDMQGLERVEDWETGFFHYRYKATAKYNGQPIAVVERSCSSREDKYAYVWVTVPKPDKQTESDLKAHKRGRNVENWLDGRKQWVWQEKRANPDVASSQFVIEAMAQKRAYVAVVKQALAANQFFTAEFDVEDYKQVYEEEMGATPPERPTQTQTSRPTSAPPNRPAEPEYVAASPEIARIDTFLLEWCKSEKGEKNGEAYYRQFWQKKPDDAKRTQATALKYVPAAPTTAEPPPADWNSNHEAQIIKIRGLIVDIKRGGIAVDVIDKEIMQICISETADLTQLSADDLDTLAEAFSVWADSFGSPESN